LSGPAGDKPDDGDEQDGVVMDFAQGEEENVPADEAEEYD
jgi:hypothetical protein